MSRKSYPSVCWGYSIFLEPRQSNVRRKPLLGISVNKGKREGNRSLPPYVCQDGVEYNDRHKRPRQGTMSYGTKLKAAEPKNSACMTKRSSPPTGTTARGATKMPHTTAATSGAPIPRPIFASVVLPVVKPQ